MNMKAFRLTSGLAALSIMAAVSHAENKLAVADGNWNSADTWGGTLPAETDFIRVNYGVTVDLTTAVTVAGIKGYGTSSDTLAGVLNIKGPDASLTMTGEGGASQFWYNARIDINVTDGANLAFKTLAWGSGGFSNIYVTDSTFSLDSFSECQGALKSLGGSVLSFKGSTKAKAGGDWNLSPTSGGYMISTYVDGAELDMQSHVLRVRSIGSDSQSDFYVKNGGSIKNIGNFEINSMPTGNTTYSDTTARVFISGAASTINSASITVGGSDSAPETRTNVTNSLTMGTVEDGKFVAADYNAVVSSGNFLVNMFGELNVNLGSSNVVKALDATTDALIVAGTFANVLGTFNVDLGNITDLESGYYYVSLISAATYTNYDALLEKINVVDGDEAVFDKFYREGNQLFLGINYTAIPEPAAFAALFGALAIALAACRRR